MTATPLASARDLSVTFAMGRKDVLALDNVSLDVAAGEILGIVGESGSGKSTLALALARFVKSNGCIKAGGITFDGVDLLAAGEAQLAAIRSRGMGFIFQNPITTLDPTRTVGRQFFGPDGRLVPTPRAIALLHDVGLRDADRVMTSYPTELSGGMAQRVAIAMAVEHEPRLLIADEPTSALDASIRIQILDLLLALCQRNGAALVIVSHDLHAVRKYCGRVAVMYAGRIIEEGSSEAVLSRPQHPYTAALLDAVPGREGHGGTLRAIPGIQPQLSAPAGHCVFVDRCGMAEPACSNRRPALRQLDERQLACDVVAQKAGGR